MIDNELNMLIRDCKPKQQVNPTIAIIKNGIAYHDTLWFNKWRTPAYEAEIEQLVKQKKIMDHRLDNLIKIIQISKQLSE